ncbi:endonuclease [candidate division KSB1 bacterium]|nr:endonuclease [candidate division KSB1 bacterium]
MHGTNTEKNTRIWLLSIYEKLSERYSPCNWWPAESSFEVILGAILTQNTSWHNVEKALKNLKRVNGLEPENIAALTGDDLINAIRPSGFYKQKAKTIKAFLEYYKCKYNYKIRNTPKATLDIIRQELLSIYGIGEETADCILLYAFNIPTFVVDEYTKRILSRVGLIETGVTKKLLKDIIENALQKNTSLYNEFHALFVNLGKEYCRKNPECQNCPLRDACAHCKNCDQKAG